MSRGGKERLGRGLEALLGDILDPVPQRDAGQVSTVPVEKVRPNPFQPRKDFSQEEIEELARSIDANGLLQPLLVRPGPGVSESWELVAGERRFRAVSHLGWTEVPVWVRDVDDQTLLVLALVENLQREALAPLEEAEGYRVLNESFGLSQSEIARSVGKDRSTVANTLRLLHLPPSVRKLLTNGDLTAGHARALLTLEDPVRAGDLARQAVREGWSVRKTEDQARRASGSGGQKKGSGAREADPIVRALQEELRQALGTRVVLKQARKGKGVIEIPFLGTDDFERIFSILTGREASEVVE